jgi:cytochrome c peroxidase
MTAPLPGQPPGLTTAAPGAVDAGLRQAMAAAGVAALPAEPAQDADKVALGEALFFDKLLSGNKDVACATCHAPELGSGDGLSLAIGTGFTGTGVDRQPGPGRSFVARNAPSLFQRAGVDRMFWDGRVQRVGAGFDTPAGESLPAGLDSALAAQAMFPVSSPTEMRGNAGDLATTGESNELAALSETDFQGHWSGLMARILAIPAYREMFARAFPEVPADRLGFQHAANAIASFEVDRFGGLDSPFDRYVGGDDSALSDEQKQGALLFYGRARCSRCHSGPLLSDMNFHNIAAPQLGPGDAFQPPLDLGRFNTTGDPNDRFRFRTAILRNVAQTGPWMHSGAYTTLAAVVRHYRNPRESLRNYDATQLRADLQGVVTVQQQIAAGALDSVDPIVDVPLPLNDQEVDQLVAFLGSLTDPAALQRADQRPASVPSGLPVLP